MSSWRRGLRLVGLAFVGVMPGFIALALYRLVFGFRFGRGARVGFSLLDADSLELAGGAKIGHLNLITRVGRLELGEHASIGHLNILRGGERVSLGPYADVVRFNVLNAIPDHDCTTEPVSVLEMDVGAVIVSGHRIDFTDRVTLGKNVIVGGRNSSLWTHNRQQTAPIRVGDFCYLGSEIRIAPGGQLPDRCILGLGAVLSGTIDEPGSLVGGVPAKVIRPLSAEDEILVKRKVRADIPDELLAG